MLATIKTEIYTGLYVLDIRFFPESVADDKSNSSDLGKEHVTIGAT
jgi:hypothetical protein